MSYTTSEKVINAVNEASQIMEAYTEFMIAADRDTFVRFFSAGWDAFYSSGLARDFVGKSKAEFLRISENNRMNVIRLENENENAEDMALHLWEKYVINYHYDYGKLYRNMDSRNQKIVLFATIIYFANHYNTYHNVGKYSEIYRILDME